MPQLDQKATSVFAGKVVRKDLVRKVKVGANVPVFVLEYLLGKYCATDDPAAIGTLLAPIRAGDYDFVIGSRARGEREAGSMGLHQIAAGRVAV